MSCKCIKLSPGEIAVVLLKASRRLLVDKMNDVISTPNRTLGEKDVNTICCMVT